MFPLTKYYKTITRPSHKTKSIDGDAAVVTLANSERFLPQFIRSQVVKVSLPPTHLPVMEILLRPTDSLHLAMLLSLTVVLILALVMAIHLSVKVMTVSMRQILGAK